MLHLLSFIWFIRCPGLQRSRFENQKVTFEEHITKEHNMWNYLYFVVHLRTKQITEFTGPESYVFNQIKDHIENQQVRAYEQ